MILLRVQYLMMMAKGRTRSSMLTYVRTMRVFSRANVLLTFMSHASFSSGSQILTIGTLAEETQTTFSMPSANRVSVVLKEGMYGAPHVGGGDLRSGKRSRALSTGW
jgi:hypothetical protein